MVAAVVGVFGDGDASDRRWGRGIRRMKWFMSAVREGYPQMPKITTIDDAIRNPELAVFSAVFHGEHEGGVEIAKATAHALRTLPIHTRKEYSMILADALPEALMNEIRDITFEQAEAAADEWERTRSTFVRGREEGEQSGLLKGRLEALADVLELRGLVPTEVERAKIAAAADPELVDRWRVHAKHVACVADLFV